MNGMVRQLILAIGMVAAAAGTGVCNAAAEPVAISLTAAAHGDVLDISGTVTVPDGAWIIYAAYRSGDLDSSVRGYVQVQNGHFEAQVDISRWPPGAISVDANFQVMLPDREQPAVVIDRFGPSGERMSGDSVVEGGLSFRAAVASATAVKE